MVKQLGLPGMFETFSYADTHWDDLREILANYEPKLKERTAERNKVFINFIIFPPYISK